MSALLHVRLSVADSELAATTAFLLDHDGVTNVTVVPDAVRQPLGHLVMFDVAREASNEVLHVLQEMRIHHEGSISVSHTHLTISADSDRARRLAPGEAANTVVWREVETAIQDGASWSPTYAAYFVIAAVIAAAGLLTDSPILIVGAMVVGPEYGPVAAMSLGIERRTWSQVMHAAWIGAAGSALAVGAAGLMTVVMILTGSVDGDLHVGDLPLSGFVTHPDEFAVIVALAAGVAGMLAMAFERSGTLVGVLVSVTTIPAIAAIGVSAALSDWDDVGGAVAQLGINLLCLLISGIVTLRVLRRRTPRTLSAIPHR
jgi:uncharacterized hydrophobic protein (TIGR00271 family)